MSDATEFERIKYRATMRRTPDGGTRVDLDSGRYDCLLQAERDRRWLIDYVLRLRAELQHWQDYEREYDELMERIKGVDDGHAD